MRSKVFSKIFAEISFLFGIKYKELKISVRDIFLESMVHDPKTPQEIYYYFKNSYGIELSLKSIKRKIKYLYKCGYLQICFPCQPRLPKLTEKEVNTCWFEISEKGEQYCIKKYLVDC